MKFSYSALIAIFLVGCATTPPAPPSADGSPRIKINKEIPLEYRNKGEK